MAARQATKSVPVGSFNWIANERALIRQHEEQDIEDFAFSARNDLEWLNEHMADIFERNQVDMAELLKTPGRLRGKTPKTARKQILPAQGREPDTNIFDVNQPPTAIDSSDSPFYTAIAQLPTNKELSPVRNPSKSPARSLRVLQDVQSKTSDPMKDSAIGLSQVEGSQPVSQMTSQISVGDSGIWSASSNFDSQQTQQSELPSQRISLSSEGFNFAPSGPDRDSTYRTAPEDSSDPPQGSPAQTKDTMRSPSPPPPKPRSFKLPTDEPKVSERSETIEQSPVESRSFKLPTDEPKASERSETIEQSPAKPRSPKLPIDEPKAPERSETIEQPPVESADSPKKAASGPRRSGRLAERSLSPLPTSTQLLSENADDIVPPSSPPNVSHQEIPAVVEEDAPTLPTAKSPTPPPALPTSVRPETPTRSPGPAVELLQEAPAAQTPEVSPTKSSSEPPTPEVPVIRKSILNFAALPAREPLTNKKKSFGMKTTRDSHVEQVHLDGASRASWMNRKGNGKSLGASSRQIERTEKQGEEEQPEKLDLSLNRKRKSESVRDDSQKKSKANQEGAKASQGEVEAMEENLEEEGSSGETAKATALHNKTSTQRLHDKIQQLGKLNASREARSFPSAISQNASHPELSQADQEPVQPQPISKRTKSDPQGQLPHNPNPSARWTSTSDDDEEWIPMKHDPKRQLTRNNTEGVIDPKEKQIETARPQSAHKWNNSPKQAIRPAPIEARNMGNEGTPMFSLKSPTYPPKRHLPGSPLKSSFSDDWIKTPASPTRPPGEGAITAVKAHTSSVFKKAKEMLLKSSVSSASAKFETMNPGLRSWQGGNNLRQQMINDSDSGRLQESLKKDDQQLYPDLGSIIDTKTDELAPAKTFTLSKEPIGRPVAAENVIQPISEGRQTRSSRSRDTRDVTPDAGEPAPKVQKKSKAVEKAEREAEKAQREAERAEREEKLREREEKLRQAEEELRIAKEEQRKHREEEGLRRAEEQQKQKEEQMRREKEEAKRRQEERLRQEKEELKRRQQEELKRQQEEARIVKEKSPSFQGEDFDISDREEGSAAESVRGRITSSAEPERPPSRLQKGGSRFQKTGDKSKPLRPGTANKDQPKSKIGPVSISVGTASQREMQSQRSKPNLAPSTSTLVAALKQSFENPGLQASSSQTSLTSSTSANSLRSSNPTGSKQLKSLTAAANQLKKEQEDKARKEAMKRDIERRRLETQKVGEDARKRPKQAPTSTQKTLSRTQTVANLRQTSEEPERRMDFKSSVNSKPVITKTAVKRGFQPETTEDQQQYRQAPTKPGAPVYQQDGAKKRRTGEYDERSYEMAPPIRQSVAKKEIILKSAIPHGYTQALSQTLSAAGSSMLRPPTKPGAPTPQVEVVKFSKDKIRFAAEAAAGPSAGPPSTFKTPGAKSASKLAMLKTPAGAKDSPIYQNGELIELPDIPTDSEDDEDDDYSTKDNFNVPQWAESPELRALLRQQQTVNPEEIFGPMAKLDMDAIFQNRTDKQAHRFRARTSSANWSGADRLTAAEIAADHEARQKMIAQGGWKYQPPS